MDTIARIAKQLLDKGEVELARELLAGYDEQKVLALLTAAKALLNSPLFTNKGQLKVIRALRDAVNQF